jgi:hypothetical protein
MQINTPIRCGLAALSLVLAACTSNPTTITSTPSEGMKSLGQTEGSACGSMLLLQTSASFIPVGLNERVQTAYDRALKKKPGATALVNVTVQQNWYWWIIGTAHCATVKGEAMQ